MKAGGAGSIPDNAKLSDKNHTQALSNFKKTVGNAVFNLNTIVVGLDAVDNGYLKPAGLNISWAPVDQEIAVRKTRKYVLETVLVHVSEALRQYILAISTLSQFSEVREKWKLKENPPPNSSKKKETVSIAEKFVDIAYQLVGKKEYRVSGAALLLHWRNHVVHSQSNAKLKHDQKRLLQKNEETISKEYSGLSVDCILCHFSERRPTLKDISSLISMTVRIVQQMDKSIYEGFEVSDLKAWLDYYGVTEKLAKIERETEPSKVEASISRVFSSHAPKLLNPYLKYRDEISGSKVKD